MADPLQSLPPEYQAQIAEFLRKKQMAQMFQQQALQGMQAPTQFTPGPQSRAVRTNPLATLAQGLTAYLGNKSGVEADQGIAGVQKKFADSESEAVRSFMGLAPDQQNAQGLSSQSPSVRRIAEELGKRRHAAALAQGPALIRSGMVPEGSNVLATGTPQGGISRPAAPEPQQVQFPDPNNPGKFLTGVVETDPVSGKKTFKTAQGQVINIDNRQPGREQEAVLADLKSQRKERQDKAVVAKEGLSANIGAIEALNEGARSGGLEGWKQGLRKALQGIGVNLPETSKTEQLEMSLGQNLLAQARKLAPVTSEDIKRLERILGSIGTDPDALFKALAIYNSIAVKELQDFNKWVGHQTDTLTDPTAKAIFSGANIGFEVPGELPGTASQGLRTVQELRKRGGDITQFQVPGGINQRTGQYESGGPIEAGATFNIQGRGMPASVSAGAVPRDLGKPLDMKDLTPEQLKALETELQRLRGGR